ncbi:MAG: helix-turn-helix domain-containing protein [Gammaproteobacteria bacterium]|nr:helix-turn-helix domain-containing protein [Gammaproteobacteria bacterium]
MPKESDIINQIIDAARAQGISQGQLAARAGIRQETLSRAKKNSNLSFNTVLQLAQIVGLKLKLIADNPVADKVQEGTLFPSSHEH